MNRVEGLKAFLVCEVVLMAGVLLFEMPVLISRNHAGEALDSRFSAVVVVTAVIFMAAGIAGLLRHTFLALLHLLAAALSFVSTMMLVAKGLPYTPSLPHWIYFIPVIYSVIASGIVIYLEKILIRKRISL